MKWTNDQVAILRTMCEEGVSNAKIAAALKIKTTDVYAKRSQLGITIDKVKAAKGEMVHTDPWPPIAKAFDRLDKALIDAAAIDPENAQALRQVAGGISIFKSLLLDAVR